MCAGWRVSSTRAANCAQQSGRYGGSSAVLQRRSRLARLAFSRPALLLAASAAGIPIEIYVFSGEQRWVQYEGIMGDIFDHLLAVLDQFDLRVFQQPSGADLRALSATTGAAD